MTSHSVTHIHIHSWGWSHVFKPYRYGQRDNMYSCSWFTYRRDHCFLKPDPPIIQTWQLRVHTKHFDSHLQHQRNTLWLLNFKKTPSALKVQIKGTINIWRKWYFFPQNTAATLYFKTRRLREKHTLMSCLQTMCSVAAWRSAWNSTRGPQRPLPTPGALRVHLLQQAGKIAASRWENGGFCAKASLLLFELQLGTRTGPWINYARIYAQS